MLDRPEAADLHAHDVPGLQEPHGVHSHAHALGVPVVMTSPGSSGKTCEANDTSSATVKIMSSVEVSWRNSPLTHVRMRMSCGSPASSAEVIHGPMGMKPHPLLARIHCGSAFWRSRALTSSTHMYPNTCSRASAAGTRCARVPMTTPSSPS